jgi:hypothetical protein
VPWQSRIRGSGCKFCSAAIKNIPKVHVDIQINNNVWSEFKARWIKSSRVKQDWIKTSSSKIATTTTTIAGIATTTIVSTTTITIASTTTTTI